MVVGLGFAAEQRREVACGETAGHWTAKRLAAEQRRRFDVGFTSLLRSYPWIICQIPWACTQSYHPQLLRSQSQSLSFAESHH